MKYLFLLLLITLTATASLPPTSSKGDGETVYKTTFKTDYGTIPVTRTGTTMALGTIPISMGGTGSTLQNFVDITSDQTIAGEKFFADSGALDNIRVDHSGTGDGVDISHAGSGDALKINVTGTGKAIRATGDVTITGNLSATNFTGSSSGTNTGDQDLSNYVDKTTVQTITATKTFSTTGAVSGTQITHNGTADSLFVDQQGAGLALNVNGGTQIVGNIQHTGNLTTTGTTTINTGITGPIRATAGVLSTSAINLASEVSGILPIVNGGTGSSTKNFVDLTTGQTVAGLKQFSDSVGIGGAANANAILDVQSTTKAFLPPRMTDAQMKAIPSPAVGMVVYNTDYSAIATYNGTIWTFGFANLNLDNTYSAEITTTTGAVARENKDFISSCTAANPTVCTFTSGYFSVAPNCVTTGKVGAFTEVNATSTTVSIYTTVPATGLPNANAPLQLVCQKSGADYLSASSNVYGVSSNKLLNTTVFSATIDATTRAVSSENMDWINGSCTAAAVSTCTFNSGIFTVPPSCTATAKGGNRTVMITALSSASTNLYMTTLAQADNFDTGIELVCQKQGVDYTNAFNPLIVGSFQNYVSTPNILKPKMGSAKISAGGVALVDNGDMMLGNCSLPGPTGRFACNFETGFFTNTPVCTATQFNNSGGTIIPVAFIESLSNTAIEVRTVTSGAYSFDAFFLMCHGD